MSIKKTLLVFSILLSTLFVIVSSSNASAAFSANNIIDDSHFENSTIWSSAQIDSFINGFGSSCIASNNGFRTPDPQGWSSSQARYLFGGNVTAGQAIYDASQLYHVNPQVILATMQKEQSLVTGGVGCHSNTPDPSASQNSPCGSAKTPCTTACPYSGGCMTIAMGYGCPNYCAAVDEGFSMQLTLGTWLLRFGEQRAYGRLTGYVGYETGDEYFCYSGPMTAGLRQRSASSSVCGGYPGTQVVNYDGSYTTQDGTSVTVANGSTATMYNFTPFISGNQNFVNLYESWFGATKGVDYSWQYAGINFSTGSSSVVGNSQVTITVSAKNTGNQAWSNTNFPVRLATFAPTNHGSALYNPSWVSQTRLATLNESVVQPNDVGTFTFVANIPNINGPYYERFNLVAEGATWFPDPDFSIDLNISQSTYKWQMVSQSSNNGFRLTPGSSAQFTLVAKNTGNITWTNSGNPVRLATFIPTNRNSAFYDPSWVSTNRPAVLQEASVAPGQNGTFVFTVTAPSTPGFYIERFNLVMEGVAWFQDPWMEFDISVGNFYTWSMASQSSNTGSFVLPTNGTATFTLTARNTGNVTWSNSTNPLRLATWNPSYRHSVFDDGTWVNSFRAANLTEASVAPGQTGTFVFGVKAPGTAGFYVERFNLVAEGLAWFQDPWLEFDITVQ